jgi:hypothetical protein
MVRRFKIHQPHPKTRPEDRELGVALRMLKRAQELAQRFKCPPTEFAVELHQLHNAGVSTNTLRSLICDGCVEHVVERTTPRSTKRTFSHSGNLRFVAKSCFMLSVSDVKATNQLLMHNASEMNGEPEVPTWDAETRTLFFGHLVVKRFKQPAGNQGIILVAFQSQGWPRCISDPLPIHNCHNPKERLHDAIKNLNHAQENSIIHFTADGTSRGVCWKITR